jgi:hypothetical protein
MAMQRSESAHGAWALGLFCCGALASADAQVIWQSDWFSSAPPTFARIGGIPDNGEGMVAYAANGDVVLASESYAWYDYQIVRIGADGSLRWSSNLGGSLFSLEGAPNATIATADGGALVAFGQSYYSGTPEYVVRIDPMGRVAWARQIPAQALGEIAPDRIVATGCNGVTMLDAASGEVAWQTTFSTCPEGSHVAFDDASNIYTLVRADDGVHAVREDAAGNVVWNVALGMDWNGVPAIVAASGDLVYAKANGTLLALQVADGAIAWTVRADGRLLVATNPVEPVLVGSGSAKRFAAASGQVRWTASVSDGGAVIVGSDLIAGNASLRRIDLASGSIVWTTALPGGGNYFSVGASSPGTVVAAASRYFAGAAPPKLERVAIADGAVAGAVAVPSVAQAPFGQSDGQPSGPIVGVLAAWTANAPQLRTRRLDPATGSTLWEVAEPIDPDILGNGLTPNNVVASVAAGESLAVTAAYIDVYPGSFDIGAGLVWVAGYDPATGQRRWQVNVRDADGGAMFSASPVFDAHGDILLATGARVACGTNEGPLCARRSVYKLSKADGHVVWQSAQRSNLVLSSVWPGLPITVGDDVIVAGPYFDESDAPALRYVTGSGATLWTSNVFSRDDIAAVRATPSGILVVGNGDGWAELDAATGAPHWTSPAFSTQCWNACDENRGIVLPDGDLLVIGEGGYQSRVSRLATDGSGAYRNWTLVPDNDAVRSQAVDVRSDGSGIRLNLLHGNAHGPGGVSVLARFDPETGALLTQQVLRGRSGGLLEPITSGGWIGDFDGDRLLMNTIAVDSPAPTAWGNALIDTTITAHGDIVLRVGVDYSAFDATGFVGINAHMTYTGDAPLAGAHVDIYVPWHSGVRDAACAVIAASNCTFEDEDDGNLRATVDLSPGAAVDLTARVRPVASDGAASMLTGVAYGPIGLDETNTLNNLAQKSTARNDAILTNGFDGS